jgi:hypothetical protein
MKIIKNIKLEIDEKEVLRYQGYSKNKVVKPNELILKIIQEEITRSYDLFNPQGIYSWVEIKSVSISERKVDLENNFSLTFSNSIINLLKESDYLVLGVVTIGSSLENTVSELFSQGEYPRALALDAIGTVAVEALSKHLRNLVCREAKDINFRTTRHFSPGYGDWDINQQKEIFKIIPTHQIKVSLTKSGMMIPRKSLSWAIGLGEKISPSSKEDNLCKICSYLKCQYRKILGNT